MLDELQSLKCVEMRKVWEEHQSFKCIENKSSLGLRESSLGLELKSV